MSKRLWTVGAIAVGAIPIITVVSCGISSNPRHSTPASSLKDIKLSEGLSIDGSKIGIDFDKANIDSPQFASDVLNFFNAHKGEQVVVVLFNSQFTKINNHEATMRVSINGFSSLNQLMETGLKTLNDNFVDLTSEKLSSYDDVFGSTTTYHDVQSEKEHEVAATNYEAKIVEINAAEKAELDKFAALGKGVLPSQFDPNKGIDNVGALLEPIVKPIRPQIISATASTQELQLNIANLDKYITDLRNYIKGYLDKLRPVNFESSWGA